MTILFFTSEKRYLRFHRSLMRILFPNAKYSRIYYVAKKDFENDYGGYIETMDTIVINLEMHDFWAKWEDDPDSSRIGSLTETLEHEELHRAFAGQGLDPDMNEELVSTMQVSYYCEGN